MLFVLAAAVLARALVADFDGGHPVSLPVALATLHGVWSAAMGGLVAAEGGSVGDIVDAAFPEIDMVRGAVEMVAGLGDDE